MKPIQQPHSESDSMNKPETIILDTSAEAASMLTLIEY
jgi:hypothetical protein